MSRRQKIYTSHFLLFTKQLSQSIFHRSVKHNYFAKIGKKNHMCKFFSKEIKCIINNQK